METQPKIIHFHGHYLVVLMICFINCMYIACSNSQTAYDLSDILEQSEKQKCYEGDIKFSSEDSTYYKCTNNKWEMFYEKWTQTPIAQRFLSIEQGKLIPNANFNTPFTLSPPKPLHNGSVRCTFDGSEPHINAPLFLQSRIIDTTTVVRCTEFLDTVATQTQTETYFINETIHMPVISISVAPSYVSDFLDARPCEPNPCKSAIFWEDVEKPSHIEYFAEGSSSKNKDFELDAGISITGNWSRNQQKKSVTITLRKEYTQKRLHYSLFNTRPEKNIFKSFILRNNGQRFISDYIEDAMATSLLEGSNVDYQRSKQVIVFYNGQYRGIYDMREKLNEHFIETNYGLSQDDIDMVKHKHTTIDVINGDINQYLGMLHYIYNNDFKENNAVYDSITKIIDIPNFMEYIAAEIYYHNNDWPQNNVRAWKSRLTPWKFIAFDIDMGFDWTKNIGDNFEDQNMLKWIVKGGRHTGPCKIEGNFKCFHNIFTKLIQNQSFKQAFINRAVYFYSTFINKETITNAINAINETIDKEQIVRDQKLYKRPNYRNACGNTFDPYGVCLKKWSNGRDISVREEFRDFFNLGKDVSISIEIKGNGRLKLDGHLVSPKSKYYWTVFEKHPMQLTIECPTGTFFKSWENGSSAPSRVIKPRADSDYVAECL